MHETKYMFLFMTCIMWEVDSFEEHTFVPPHETSCQVEGHRFCSDCWIDFLDHGLLALT